MILTCSSCATRFLVDAAAIGPAGRHVRCARCQHGWFQEPAADLPRTVPPAVLSAEISAQEPMARVAPQHGRPPPLRSGANLPALPRRANRTADMIAWAALAAVAALLLSGVYMFREQIIHAWPQTARLYALAGLDAPLGGLRLSDIAFSRGMQEGRPALIVKGVIHNEGAVALALPVVLIKLHDAAGRDIFHWTYKLPETEIAAGARAPFETSLADPPAAARNLQVTFAPES